MKIDFTKMSGAGNDFIVIDNRSGAIALSESDIRRLCARRTGIGADGLMLMEHSRQHDFAMRYFNADGKPSSMCGNGGRCITRFAYLSGIEKTHFSFEANGETYFSEILDSGRVKLKMQPPKAFRNAFEVEGVKSFFIDTGSPHAVVYVADVASLNVLELGRRIRHNREHFPEGTNVNFVEPLSENRLRIRTFERGVEDETLACGTGCVAAAVVSYKLGKVHTHHILLTVQSGETIEVELDDALQNVYLIGSAEVVFTGTVWV
ncbi:MAG: diaminopimelate epimerase [Candidatus Thermochlorobacter sp.]